MTQGSEKRWSEVNDVGVGTRREAAGLLTMRQRRIISQDFSSIATLAVTAGPITQTATNGHGVYTEWTHWTRGWFMSQEGWRGQCEISSHNSEWHEIYNFSMIYFWNVHLLISERGCPQVMVTAGSETVDPGWEVVAAVPGFCSVASLKLLPRSRSNLVSSQSLPVCKLCDFGHAEQLLWSSLFFSAKWE